MVAESWRTYSSGVCCPSPSGSVAVMKSSAARAESATSSRIEKGKSAARIACCWSSSRSRRAVQDACHVDRAVRLPAPQHRQVQHQYTPSTTVDAKPEKGRTLRTPSHG